MNAKGQSAIDMIMIYIFFIILWFAWLGQWFATIGEMAMATGNFTGLEAFFYSHLNLVVFVVFTIAIIGGTAYLGE